MQRWMLKLFLSHAVTKQFEVQQGRPVTFPGGRHRFTAQPRRVAENLGLWVAADPTNKGIWYDPFKRKEALDVD